MSTRTPGICLNCEHPVPAHGEEVCGQPSTFPDGTPYQCGCTWGDDDQDDVAEEPAPAAIGDHFTEAAIRRGVMLAAADEAENAAKLFPDNIECAPAIGALEGLAARFKRLADHYATAEQPSGPTWESRADHAIRLYATTAIERDDTRAENARLRAQLAEAVEGWRQAEARLDREHAVAELADAEQCAQHPAAPRIGDMCGGCTQYPADMTGTTAPRAVTVGHVETALRAWLTDFDYDRHKALQCGKDDGEDHYPDEAEAFFECLLAAAGQAARDAFEERIDAEVTAHGPE